ncbi:MAG: class I SAM-dependent methyltransferase [Bacillota bacterium]
MSSFQWTQERIKWYLEALRFGEYPGVFLPYIAPLLLPTDTVLDVGAGTGAWSLQLAPLVSRVTALDPSELALNALKEEMRVRGIVNIELMEMKWADFDGPAHDVCLCAHAASALTADPDGIARFSAKAKRLCLVITAESDEKNMFGLGELFKMLDMPVPKRGGAYTELAPALKRAGVSPDIKRVSYEFGQPVKDETEACAFIRALVPGENLPDDALRRFVTRHLTVSGSSLYLPSTNTALLLSWTP